MAVNLSSLGGAGWQFFDNNGVPLAGGKLYVYSAGTTTPSTTYTSSIGSTPNTNPIILDSTGRVTEEIWVTAGSAYKFVLKTSADVLIWTKDNISGINDFTGAETDIYANFANTSDVAKGDALVGFRQSNSSGLLAGTVGRTVHQKLQEIVSFKDFGAVGDGVTDDTVAVQAALNSGAKVIDGQSLDYLISVTVTGTSETRIQNAVFLAPTLATNTSILSFTGTKGTDVPLTANTGAQTFSIKVGDTASFTVDGWAYISSTANVASAGTALAGEIVRIKSIVGNYLNLYNSVIYDYNTTDAAVVAPLTMLEDIILDNLEFYGPVSVNNQKAVTFEMCAEVSVNNCNTYDFDYYHFGFIRCANYTVRGGASSRTGLQEGLDYGVVHSNGCFNGLVDGYTGNSMRHISTIGGSSGISRFIRVVNCFGYNITDGGIDSHVNCWEHEFINNFLAMSDDADTSIEGIISQGGLPIISGNIIQGARRHGVEWQPLFNTSMTSKLAGVISNNIIRSNKNVVGTAAGVNVTVGGGTSAAGVTAVTVTNNQLSNFDTAVLISTAAGVAISNVIVSNNSTILPMVNRGVHLAANNGNMTNVVISGNVLTGGLNEMIYLQGSVANSSFIYNAVISDNIINGGAQSLRLVNCNKVTTSNNQFIGYSSSSPRVVSTTTNYMAYDLFGATVLADIQQTTTIASGIIAIDNPIRRLIKADTEGAAASDDLDTISGGYTGQVISIYSTNSGRDIVCKDGTGNLKLAGDITLSHPDDRLTLEYDGTNWYQISFADNGV